MKNKLLYLGLIICGTANAQPILTHSGIAPVIGDSYSYQRISWDGTFPSAGVNQTWDFSNIVSTSTTSLTFVDPSTCPSPSSFPSANISENYDNQQYYYNSVTTSEFNIDGIYAGGVAIPYSNPEKRLKYPFNYNDSFVDSFGGTFVSSGFTFVRGGTITVTADAYGTLILPNATVSNVFRVKVSEDYSDSLGSSEYAHYNSDIFLFYKAGYHTPILSLTHFSQAGNVTNYGFFIDDVNLNIITKKESTLKAYPNPFKSSFFVETIDKNTNINVYNAIGSLVYSTQTTVIGKTEISLMNQPKGIYFVKVKSDKGTKTLKIIKD